MHQINIETPFIVIKFRYFQKVTVELLYFSMTLSTLKALNLSFSSLKKMLAFEYSHFQFYILVMLYIHFFYKQLLQEFIIFYNLNLINM